jgi:hypothetical protein
LDTGRKAAEEKIPLPQLTRPLFTGLVEALPQAVDIALGK